MSIDPQAWLVTLPLLGGLLWVYAQPAEHRIKQLWRELLRHEAHAMTQVVGVEVRADAPGRVWVERVLFWASVAALSIGSAASVATYLGWLSMA